VSHVSACYAHPEATACFLCQGDSEPDPYGELVVDDGNEVEMEDDD
jgi:hypothetical protein